MIEGMVFLGVFAVIVNVCAAVVSVIFAIQAFLTMRRVERQRREMWGQR